MNVKGKKKEQGMMRLYDRKHYKRTICRNNCKWIIQPFRCRVYQRNMTESYLEGQLDSEYPNETTLIQCLRLFHPQ